MKQKPTSNTNRGVLYIKSSRRPSNPSATLCVGAGNPPFEQIKHLLSDKPLRPPVRR
jgi:hypothetical protein